MVDKIKAVLGYGTDRIAEQKEFAIKTLTRSAWDRRPEVVEVLRFPRTYICSNCNNLNRCRVWSPLSAQILFLFRDGIREHQGFSRPLQQ